MKLESETLKFLIVALPLTFDTLNIADVSEIDPVFLLPFTMKSYITRFCVAPIEYKSSRVFPTKVSFLIVRLVFSEKK